MVVVVVVVVVVAAVVVVCGREFVYSFCFSRRYRLVFVLEVSWELMLRSRGDDAGCECFPSMQRSLWQRSCDHPRTEFGSVSEVLRPSEQGLE